MRRQQPAPGSMCYQGCPRLTALHRPCWRWDRGQQTRLSTTARDKARTGCRTGDNTTPVPGCRAPRAPAHTVQLEQQSRRALCSARDGREALPQLQKDPERCVRTMLELPGSANQLQPARPCTRNIDEALPNRSVQGRRLGGPAVGCSAAAPAAPRHSPRCQRVSSTVTWRRWWGPGPACWPHGAGTEPETSSAQTGGERRRQRRPLTLSREICSH